MYSPVDVCKKDGVTLIDPSTADSGQSGCNGGDQYQCSCMQPFNDTIDPSLTYGFAAFTSGNEQDTDCGCYLAEFAHDAAGKPMKRNKMIFQVINTGGDVQAENVDIQIPGGGLGAFPEGCPKQWGVALEQWGQQYGGLSSEDGCKNLPEQLREGCKWRFQSWADNPVLKGKPQRIKCPKGLIDRSGCQRKDEASVQAYSGKTDAKGQAATGQYKRDRSVCLGGAAGGKEGYSPQPKGDTPAPAPGTGTGAGSAAKGPEGYSPSTGGDASVGAAPGSDATSSLPQGYGDESQPTEPAPGSNNTGPAPGSDSKGAAPGSASNGAGQQGNAPSTPPAQNVPRGHKMNKVCRKH